MSENNDILKEIENSLNFNNEEELYIKENVLESEEIKNIEIDFSEFENKKQIKYTYETIVKKEKNKLSIFS
jgi:hypothetical protein